MSAQSASRRLTLLDLAKMKASGEKIAMLTCYDASFAKACDEAGIVITSYSIHYTKLYDTPSARP